MLFQRGRMKAEAENGKGKGKDSGFPIEAIGNDRRGGWDREGRNEVSLGVIARGGIKDSGSRSSRE